MAPAQVVKPSMWIDVVIVALLLGVGAFLNQTDWRTRFLTHIRTAGNPMVKAAQDAVAHIRPKASAPTSASAAPRPNNTAGPRSTGG